MLTYLQVHQYLVIPPIVILGTAYWPLLGRREAIKFLWLGFMATLWTTPWDNFILSQGGWTYPPGSILGTIGYVPIEEHMFFILQPVLLILLQCILTHGRTLSFDLEPLLRHTTRRASQEEKLCPNKQSKPQAIQTLRRRPIAAILWLLLTLLGARMAYRSHEVIDLGYTKSYGYGGGRQMFYLGWILAWIPPVIAFLTFLGARLNTGDLWTLGLGTFWFWVVDTIALNSGSWTIARETTLGIDVWPGLPIEEAIFFFLTSHLVLLACSLMSHLHTLLLLCPALPPCPPANPIKHIVLLADVAFRPPSIGIEILVGLAEAERTLRKGSKSFDVAKLAFGREMRLGLMVVYAWCRVTDNLIDEPYIDQTSPSHSIKSDSSNHILETARRQTLQALRAHLIETYNTSRYSAPSYPAMTGATSPQNPLDQILDTIPHLSPEDRTAFHLFSSIIPRLVPIYPFMELCDGYAKDLTFPSSRLSLGQASQDAADLADHLPIKTTQDLLKYADDVAGSIASAICYLAWSVLDSDSPESGTGIRPVDDYSFATTLHGKTLGADTLNGQTLAVIEPASESSTTLANRSSVISSAREMGRALQLVNIARDVAKDALISRLYVPVSYFASAQALIGVLFPGSSTRSPCYARYTLPLLDLADSMRLASEAAMEDLPRTARGGTRAMVASYFEIAEAVRSQDGEVDERGVKVSKAKRVGKALAAMWGLGRG
ncbi:hypothetical protein IAU60_002396 [Kwoniella sp. DSM 27419]